jgi:hypothetical protein
MKRCFLFVLILFGNHAFGDLFPHSATFEQSQHLIRSRLHIDLSEKEKESLAALSEALDYLAIAPAHQYYLDEFKIELLSLVFQLSFHVRDARELRPFLIAYFRMVFSMAPEAKSAIQRHVLPETLTMADLERIAQAHKKQIFTKSPMPLTGVLGDFAATWGFFPVTWVLPVCLALAVDCPQPFTSLGYASTAVVAGYTFWGIKRLIAITSRMPQSSIVKTYVDALRGCAELLLASR